VSLWYVIKGEAGFELDCWGRREFASAHWWPMEDWAHADGRFDPCAPRFIAKLNARTV
jgi:hypothetical protein